MTKARYILHQKRLAGLPNGKHSDGGGLYFYKLPAGTQWVFRYTWEGRRREMGLGGYPKVSLADAREATDRQRAIFNSGQNPKDVKDAAAQDARRDTIRNSTLEVERRKLKTVAPLAFEARKAELKDRGKAGRWFSPLAIHVLPKLGEVQVSDIDAPAIAKALRPIWHDKADTARKAITRLDACLKHARALGFETNRHAVADAREILGKQLHTPEHIPSMPWEEVPIYYDGLGGSVVELALRLSILVGGGVRSKPIRFLHTGQLDDDIWTVPGDEMKGRKGKVEDYAVPLSTEAMRVIELARAAIETGTIRRVAPPSGAGQDDFYLFPGEARAPVISDMSMSARMKRAGMAYRPHGFRASFRTWADEQSNATFEVKEWAIAHNVGTATTRAYARGTAIEQRRILLEQWAWHVAGQEGEVLPFAVASIT